MVYHGIQNGKPLDLGHRWHAYFAFVVMPRSLRFSSVSTFDVSEIKIRLILTPNGKQHAFT